MGENLPRLEGDTCHHEKPLDSRSDSRSQERDRDQELLQTTGLVVRVHGLADLFKEFASQILKLTGCTFLKFSLHDPLQDCMVTHYWKGNHENGEFDAFPVDECVSGWVWTHQQTATISDAEKEKRFPLCMQELRRHGVRSYAVVPLSAGQHRFGAMGLGKRIPEVVAAEDLEFYGRVAFVVALALENQEIHHTSQNEQARLQGLVTIAQELTSTLEMESLVTNVLGILRQITGHEHAVLMAMEDDGKTLRRYAIDSALADKFAVQHVDRVPLHQSLSRRAIETRKVTVWNAEDTAQPDIPAAEAWRASGIQCVINAPLLARGEVLGALKLGSVHKNAFDRDETEYLQQVANLIAGSLRNARAYQEVAQLKDRLAGEKRYLESEIRSEMRWEEIVGGSSALKRVLDYASIVATTDSTVLITGETGTGKERVARAIHSMSRRKDRSFIKLNCAAIPTGLLESELFGHEKGAFTGAVSQKIGRLELADKGTLFLDEIGEIALELQPKLLRVLQDQEFERLGGTRTIRVDARLIAATNRDLTQAVEEKQFRSDLFYRLHVFPLHLPALRDRREDISLLVHHFVEKSSARLGRHINSVPQEAMDAMLQWSWPGNIRELENFIERSVILSEGTVLRAPLSELRQEMARQRSGSEATLEDREREHIIDVLRHTRGILSGPRGAAARLGLKRTTLQYKLQKLGISRTDYLD